MFSIRPVVDKLLDSYSQLLDCQSTSDKKITTMFNKLAIFIYEKFPNEFGINFITILSNHLTNPKHQPHNPTSFMKVKL
ncbi:hypothetical protein C9940_04615 [Pseudidiomarina aestuarii]|uniref:Uncharacterized protein n=1 Tax=Pseudidiomarina aestuarii TaxID=624146 RepID=A0A2T4CWD8_9GAMM|nr:hypothetical protein C9940_04615 [Pseudidiomarina aestuarii]